MARHRGMYLVVAVGLVALLVSALPMWAPWVARERIPGPTRDYAAQDQVVRATTADLKNTGYSAPRCAATVLRIDGPTVWAMAECSWAIRGTGDRGSSSGPVRVDGTKVIWPRDGESYEEGVRANFPWDVAQLVLSHREDLAPRGSDVDCRGVGSRRTRHRGALHT